MAFQTILSAADLKNNLKNPDWAILDCRFDFQETELGFQDYLAGHIPGAIYIHLDRDLSSEMIPGKSGRHPLPDSTTLATRLSAWGIDDTVQVVIYDSSSGGVAARMWWLLRWLGHENAAVLNGGWPAWAGEDYPVESGETSRAPRKFILEEHPKFIVDLDFVERIRLDPDYLLVDCRSAERYWGINETTDPVAGHIPGAVTAPYAANLDKNGFFLKTEDLKARFDNLLEGIPTQNSVFYCGSGVTAAHNILAMIEAGYGMPKLYPGSWSEWITDPKRPVEP
jgi:thiosulfate/3-mercaptopyruvate sulfurtransferase